MLLPVHDLYDNDWKEVSRGDACAICGHDTWCAFSPTTGNRICRRNPSDDERSDKHGVLYWLHRSDDGVSRSRIDTKPKAESLSDILLPGPAPSTQPLEPDQLHEVYEYLLQECGLAMTHREHLVGRGLEVHHVIANGYASLPHSRRRGEVVRRLVNRFPLEVLVRVPGLYWKHGSLHVGGTPGILVPTRDAEGRIVALVIRADEPGRGGKYQMLSSKRHGGASPGAPAHLPRYDGGREAVGLTEGVLKADVATAIGGRLVIGCPGLAWRTSLPLLSAVGARSINLAFDMDAAGNPHVQRARDEAAVELLRMGYEVALLSWNSGRKGVDDALAARVTIERLQIALPPPPAPPPTAAATQQRASGGAPACEMPPLVRWPVDPVVTKPIKRGERCEKLVLGSIRQDGTLSRPRIDCQTWSCGDCAKDKVTAILEILVIALVEGRDYYVGDTISDKMANARLTRAASRARERGEAVEYLRVRRDHISDEYFFSQILYLSTINLTGTWRAVTAEEAYRYAREEMLALPGACDVSTSKGWKSAEERAKKPWPGLIGAISNPRLQEAYWIAAEEIRSETGLSIDPDVPIHDADLRDRLWTRMCQLARDPRRKSVDDKGGDLDG